MAFDLNELAMGEAKVRPAPVLALPTASRPPDFTMLWFCGFPDNCVSFEFSETKLFRLGRRENFPRHDRSSRAWAIY